MRSILLILVILSACKTSSYINFKEVAQIDLGDSGAAEITAYDPQTKKLFVVNNGSTNKIDVISFDSFPIIRLSDSINIRTYGGFVNSVAVSNGLLAAAIEGDNKQDKGSIVIFRTSDHQHIRTIQAGALPDMVTFTPDGNFILSANEGEPSPDYKVDPEGSVSIISVKEDFNITTIDFSIVNEQIGSLKSKGFRTSGRNEQLKKDVEPEYIAVSGDSKFAWITLQENNAIARIDIMAKKITDIFPLGFKDHSDTLNAIDVSDMDGKVDFKRQPVKGMFMPDAISFIDHMGEPLVLTANEGDTREYEAFTENRRVKASRIDSLSFTDTSLLKDQKLGRLVIDTLMGDPDLDGDIDELYSFGGRSFSVWNGNTGKRIWDSHNQLEKLTHDAGLYDDTRSDDKGVEAEGITIGTINKRKYAFIGLDRADCIAIYDITDPFKPRFRQLLKVGDGPEGVLFVTAENSPNKKPLLIVGSENDGQVRIFSAQ